MIDGFYSVEFETVLGSGGGVVVLEDGSLRGGDSKRYFLGSYRIEDQKLLADVHVGTHMDKLDIPPVFGVNELDLKITGKLTASAAIEGTARSPQRPDSVMVFNMKRISG
ncbi:GrlR family regulatory protein [Ketogulonicigenium vulgare]|uniref:Type III secretion system (T3SS) negative regulator GrlR n=1 Tax=Ketogulonicigenium vulgare (strain WSH-001) TaxID=759362 RepID=F9Y9R5_KETVW|nr:GrlR family regulatory protein [Ketogulonicigenium vulgare]ADO43112.1 conserved hypothetical protein [Ketogulonicigenium vulgare Y25]AEM41403.1 hypothetical protein KVU_1564 [Ketogulonicigenium vulgare WSH-001]ALJ81537.1 hypothetical protein KVH_10335 [Ketogulonicigenium vulgare]ANW34237.1 hypothetical protein KvSKV_10275 [Ketogulonicigenium vulgare]AOZ55147.1 hypothetical protein KVC_2140 [Ketogulonicigenium vulgare]